MSASPRATRKATLIDPGSSAPRRSPRLCSGPERAPATKPLHPSASSPRPVGNSRSVPARSVSPGSNQRGTGRQGLNEVVLTGVDQLTHLAGPAGPSQPDAPPGCGDTSPVHRRHLPAWWPRDCRGLPPPDLPVLRPRDPPPIDASDPRTTLMPRPDRHRTPACIAHPPPHAHAEPSSSPR